jgi:hypothetical protein
VPSGKNELVDILLARAVNGESPPRSTANGKGKSRDKSLFPAKGRGKGVTDGNATKTLGKKRAPSVQETDECEPVAGQCYFNDPVLSIHLAQKAAKKSARNSRTKVDGSYCLRSLLSTLV